ncbi:hypothetical protein ENTCAN_09657 [Enterobacter cancerogenus ATCC 35316]|nr:hypothetical protein ENTCAN_09657 [Enterobacter cancerogenus ATCC 35316]
MYASRYLAHNQHMKTIRTEINSCIERGRTHTLHPSRCLIVGCASSHLSLTEVSSRRFADLPP